MFFQQFDSDFRYDFFIAQFEEGGQYARRNNGSSPSLSAMISKHRANRRPEEKAGIAVFRSRGTPAICKRRHFCRRFSARRAEGLI